MSTVAVPDFQIKFPLAERKRIKAKLGVFGPSGAGKTLGAMRMAIALQNLLDPTKPIACVDTEHERISLYAEEQEFLNAEGVTRFRVYAMKPPYSPAHYIAAYEAAEALGAQVCLTDSISHAWMGKGGVQQIVDEAAARQTGGNKWAGWSVGTPAHNSLIEKILSSPMHMVCTMRAKTEWVQVGNAPKKVGFGPIQREGIEYEFDVVLKMDLDHSAVVETSRSLRFFEPGSAVPKEMVGEPFAHQVWAWISEGAEREPAKTAEEVAAEQENEAAVAQQEKQATAPEEPPAQDPAERFDTPEAPAPAEEPVAEAPAEEPVAEAPAEILAEAPPAPVETEAAEAKVEDEEIGVTPATKGKITKAIAKLQEDHGDYDDGTDWNARLRANLPEQKWNTRKVEQVDDLTEAEANKLLATIKLTSDTIAARKAAAAATENEQQTI